jgi:hypothetical protein
MATFLLCHHHEPAECRFAFASWKGFASPLRHHPTLGSCVSGGHDLYWTVEAASDVEALAQLPPYLAVRTEVVAVEAIPIP